LPKTAVEDTDLIADALVMPGGADIHWDDAKRDLTARGHAAAQ
jgi:hypothetical protein